jgi:hypothetical protein
LTFGYTDKFWIRLKNRFRFMVHSSSALMIE